MSWQINSSCTASLYLLLKGLFSDREREENDEKAHSPHVDVHCNENHVFAFKQLN